jgi:thiamine biosynthesis lipoprotein
VIESIAWRALGMRVHLLVLDGDLAGARSIVDSVLGDVDSTYSRFRADSELCRLNASARQPTPVSPLMAAAIEVAVRAARETAGAVDPTVGRSMRLIGYDDDFGRLPDRPAPVIRFESVPGWRVIRYSSIGRTVQFPGGVELDLGSAGKAFAADLAASHALAAAPEGGVLVSLGGNMSVAGRAPDGGWRVLVAEDAETPIDAAGEVVTLELGAIATSSTTVRRWRSADGRAAHHIVDPRTGGPAITPWRTAAVAADTCVTANTAATATIVLGADGLDWLIGRGLPGRLVDVDGRVVRVGGWPEPETS